MLQLIIHITIISAFCLFWGLPIMLLHKKLNPNSGFWIRNTGGFYSFLFFAGLISLSLITSWLCLFVPMQFYVLIILTAPLLLYLFIKRKNVFALINEYPIRFSFPAVELVFIIICLFTFLIPGTLKPVNGDTQIYHVQVIRWFNEYGAVPGMANLFPRFGLGSNWFNLIGIFRLPIFSYENFTWLNTTVVIWFFIWLISNWKYHSNKNNSETASRVLSHFYFLIILFCLFEWELFRDAASSTNNDFIVTAFTFMAVCFLIESAVASVKSNPYSFFFILVCLSVIPFKLSGVFLLMLLLYYLISLKKIKYWFFTAIAGIIIVLPFLIKNYIVTGYPLFPLAYSVSSPDWQVPAAMTDYLRQYIHITNRFYNSTTLDFKHIPELMNKSWTASWFSGLLMQQKIILIASLSSLILFFFKSNSGFSQKRIRIIFSLLLVMAAGWFFSAPSPRFGYGVLMVLAFFPVCFFAGSRITISIHKPVLILTSFILCYYLYRKSAPIIKEPAHFISPVKLEQPPVKTITINGINFYLPEIINNGWMRDCFDTELPCISNENKYLKPRGTRLKDGFKMEPAPDSIFIRNYIY